MKLHELYTTPGSHKTSKRLGRGDASGKGGTSGKGTKGQMARKGHKRKHRFLFHVAFSFSSISRHKVPKDISVIIPVSANVFLVGTNKILKCRPF